eukprot:1417540-Rhodomonas_salina.2
MTPPPLPDDDGDEEEEEAAGAGEGVLRVGDKVFGHYQDGHWYSAEIVELFGDKFVVAWDDGDTEDTLKLREDLRIQRKIQRKQRTPRRTYHTQPPQPQPQPPPAQQRQTPTESRDARASPDAHEKARAKNKRPSTCPAVCAECGKEFRSHDGLKHHLMSHTGTNAAPFPSTLRDQKHTTPLRLRAACARHVLPCV